MRLAYIGILLLFLCGCKNYSHRQNVDCPVAIGYDSKECISLPLRDLQIIPLEVTEQSLLSVIQNVAIIDSMFIVQDLKTGIVCFDREGKFKHSISSWGNANHEYIRLNTFLQDDFNRLLIVDSASGRIMFFDLDGTFIKSVSFPHGLLYETNSCILLPDGRFLQNSNVIKDYGDIYTLLSLDSKDKETVYKTSLQTSGVSMPIGDNPMNKYGNDIKLLLPFDNIIYQLEDGKISPYLLVNTLKKIADDDKLSEYEDFSIMTSVELENDGYFKGFTDMFETSKYLLLGYYKYDYFIIEKQTFEGNWINNDLSHGIPLLGIIGTNGDSLIGVAESAKLQKLLDSPQISQMVKDRINEVVNIDEVDSNPYLIIYELE